MRFRKGDKVRVSYDGATGWYDHKRFGAEGVIEEDDDFGIVVRWDDSGGFDEVHDGLEPIEVIGSANDDNDEIIDLIRSRLAKGRAEYGHGVQASSGEYDWETMMLEEALDGMVYAAARLIELRRKRGDAK